MDNHRSRNSHGDLAQALEAQGDIQLGVVFGSVASGSAGPQSDLDIAVDAGKPLSSERRMALIDELARRTGRPVDLIDLHTAGQPLLGEVIRSGTRIVGSRDTWARWVSYHLIEAADFLPLRERMLEERRQAWLDRS
ncbi:MAG TPA: nucleotidyltransferase domain-containing protein [Wenzhouxiangella sp.]|nr:nucleotidyltransferase domain-containing protein [Wenzhouxiangella sp.]